jgi:hypothetical protein
MNLELIFKDLVVSGGLRRSGCLQNTKKSGQLRSFPFFFIKTSLSYKLKVDSIVKPF